MKKQNVLLIVLGLVIIAGGIWFFTNNNEKQVVDKNGGVETERADKDVSIEDKATDENDGSSNAETSNNEESTGNTSDIAKDKPAPDFTLKSLDGGDISLSDYQGKIVLLNFWATWCGYCDKEMPDLKRINDENEDVVVLAIDVGEEQDIVKKYIDKGGYNFDVALDIDKEISQTYLVSAFPTSYFIKEDGTIFGYVRGMLEYDGMMKIIEDIRSER